MAENTQRTDETSGARRFRLPRIFSETEEVTEESAAPAPRAKLSQHAAMLNAPTHDTSREESRPAPKAAAPPAPPAGDAATLMREIEGMRGEVDDISRTLQEMYERGTAQDKVFNTLHSELQDYKNDFIYEHLKPVVRPLLFLFDSLEQFDNEMAEQERAPDAERRGGLTPTVVRENIIFFREQLVESLRICEVTPMNRPQGEHDTRLHKVVDAAIVEDPEQNNKIQRVVRSGWYLNGRVFRQAEVVIGKSRENYNAQMWDSGNVS